MERSLCIVEADALLRDVVSGMYQGISDASQAEDCESLSNAVLRPSHALIVENSQLVGIITEQDIIQLIAQGVDILDKVVGDVMRPDLITLSEADAEHPFRALEIFRQSNIRHLPIVNTRGGIVGVVTPMSLLNALVPSVMPQTMTALTQQIGGLENERVQWMQQKATPSERRLKTVESRFQAIFDQTVQFLGLLDPDGSLLEINQAALEFGGLQREDVVCQPFWDSRWWTIAPETQQNLKLAIAQASQGQPVRYVVDILGAQEQIMTIDLSLRPMLDENGQVVLLILEGRDITDLKNAHLALLYSEERYAHLAAVAPVGIFHADLEGRCFYVNDLMCRLTGLTDSVLRKSGWLHAVHPMDCPQVVDIWRNVVQAKQPFALSLRLQSEDNQSLWVLVHAIPEPDSDGNINSYIGTVTNIHQRKQTELELAQLNQALFQEKELAQVTLQSIADAVITTNAKGEIQYFNPVAEQLTGWSAADAKGLPLRDVFNIINEVTRKPVENPVARVLRQGCISGLANHTVLISASGVEYSIEDSAAPIRDRDGTMIGAVMVFHDVTQARQLARQLSWQARHDPLTELPNRFQFEQELSAILNDARMGRDSSPGNALCYLDLDQFKVVNDTCGHVAGDELLRQLSRLLKQQVRGNDLIARLGGDEFGVLLSHCSLANAKAIAEKLRKAVHSFRFLWNNCTFSVGVSIGLVFLDQTIDNLDDILSAADAACYAAKDGGRNRVHVYQMDDSELVRQRGERQWSILIKQALEENRFCLYHQPIVEMTNANDASPLFYEVLLRLVNEQGQLILPGTFIPAAERYDLMPAIDRWVVQTFFSQLNSLWDLSQNSVHFINLSGASISDVQFLSFLMQQFERYAVPPQSIGFEITETAAIANLVQATRFIDELHELGCFFALDDFGSGMSSFGYLKNLSVDYLKIDGNFIADITTDSATYAIVESINHIGHVMGLKTIAESVEDMDLRGMLAQIGVDYIQGYGVEPPYPIGFPA